jgi:hypothetical protein
MAVAAVTAVTAAVMVVAAVTAAAAITQAFVATQDTSIPTWDTTILGGILASNRPR